MTVHWTRIHVDTCLSTNDEAREYLDANGSTYAVITADAQNAGRGRLGRSWFSLEGKSLMFSVVFPSPLSPKDAPKLTLVGAAALAHACSQAGVESPEVKWPNDLLVEGRKAAGILTEWVEVPGDSAAVIMGVGVNLDISEGEFPEEIRTRAGSLAAEAGDLSKVVLKGFLEVFGAYLERIRLSGEVDLELWRKWMKPGRDVRFTLHNTSYTGKATGIRDDGALQVESSDGTNHFIVAGDVIPVHWEG